MASDGRYVYHNPQEVPAPYGYAPYSAYGPDQFAQPPGRPPVRAASSQAHSPHPQPYHPPPPYPQPPYGPPYGVPPPGAQWTGEGWQHYSPYPPPHPPGQDVPYGARPDMPAANGEHRGYPPGPSRPEAHRSDDRQSRPPDAASQSAKVRKPREGEPAAPPSLGLDFVKLMDSYRLVMDSTAGFVNDAPPPRPAGAGSAETVERMLKAAAYGADELDSAFKRAAAEAPRPPSERMPDESDEGASKARQPENQPVVEGQTCLGCSATSTPEWRRGPMGPRTLCNACGLVYAKLIKKRNRDFTRGRAGPQVAKPSAQARHPADDSAAASSGEGASDDDDSYGSQEHRSDGGYHGRD
ncbi:hypothetical protein B0H21DRAFT_695152 [Amylocystis lapponica]|nr:hypothetical protein B0H21DRAFT_695152 [Amylocystis lapponica]